MMVADDLQWDLRKTDSISTSRSSSITALQCQKGDCDEKQAVKKNVVLSHKKKLYENMSDLLYCWRQINEYKHITTTFKIELF